MKVFDYSNGVKGKEIGYSAAPDSMSGCKRGNEYFIPKDKRFEFYFRASYRAHGSCNTTEIHPEAFGVQAICFCTGKQLIGTDGHWNWAIMGTDEWLDRAVLQGWINVDR